MVSRGRKSYSLMEIEQIYADQNYLCNDANEEWHQFTTNQSSDSDLKSDSERSLEISASLSEVFRIYKVAIKFLVLDTERHIFLKIEELTQDIELSMLHLQRNCQVTLTNALSHERITPLNKIITMA